MIEQKKLAAVALALLCRPAQNANLVPVLSESEWEQILAWGREHRFLPYLQYALRQADLLSHIPVKVRERLSEAYGRSVLRALTRQGDMIAAHLALDEAGIDHIFLKGAYLAHFAYPAPALRPLRDIDVLVPKSVALEAYDVLQAAGFVRDSQYRGSAEAFLDGDKHLPRLISPLGKSALELHVQMTSSAHRPNDGRDPSTQELMERALPKTLANNTLRFPSPEDMLIHLSIHAVYEHEFDNGPLTVIDLHWLIATHKIDWPRVWSIADGQGVTRGVVLMLKLLERLWPASREGFQSDSVSTVTVDAGVINDIANVMFRSFVARSDVALLEDLTSRPKVTHKVAHILCKAFPSRRELAKEFPVSSNPLTMLRYYPKLWQRLLGERLPEFVKNTRNQHRRAEADSLSRIKSWLNSN